MKTSLFSLLIFLSLKCSDCLGQIDSLNTRIESKGKWQLFMYLGNAGISDGVFDLEQGEGDASFFYDQFNSDNLEVMKYSYGLGIARVFSKVTVELNYEKGMLNKFASLYKSSDLGYSEIKITDDYSAISASVLKGFSLDKFNINLGLSGLFIFSKGAVFSGYSFLKDSMQNIISESTITREYPKLFSYGIGIINQVQYHITKTISLGSNLSYYFVISNQDGTKTDTQILPPAYNVVTYTMHQNSSSTSFSGIDVKMELRINLK